MSYEYRYHDGNVIRRAPEGTMMDVEIFVPRVGWTNFPEPQDKAIGSSSIAAWMEGTPISQADAEEFATK